MSVFVGVALVGWVVIVRGAGGQCTGARGRQGVTRWIERF